MKICSRPRYRGVQSMAALLVLAVAVAHAQVQTPAALQMHQSYNPLRPFMADHVPEPVLSNSPRLDSLIRDGKLYLSLKDAIDLALENNLDLAIARYNLPIADTDLLRTKAGGVFRGVNTGVVQGTPGGGIGGFGTSGGGAGGTTGGAGGAGAGASGLVESTLGVGTPVASYDPAININMGIEHLTSPQPSAFLYGVPTLQLNTTTVNAFYTQAFSTGASISFEFDNNRQTTNSPYPYNFLSPALSSYYRFTFQQPLLAGFGFGPNLRYLRIAKNNKKISDIAFKNQVIATVTQIENIYWDLVSAFEQARVNEQSLAFANQTLENARKQLQLESIPEMDLMKAEAEVSRRDQELTVARTNLQLQESLIKNALTRSLDNPSLEEMPVVPSDQLQSADTGADTSKPILDLIAEGLRNRPELLVSGIDLASRQISGQAVRNALLPSLTLVGYYGGSGLAGLGTPGSSSSAPTDLAGAWQTAFNNSSPDYFVGLNLTIPLRNRVAKADQYRSELEYRQASLRKEQLIKQIRIEVRNAQYALEQSRARVDSARKARDLAARTFEIMKKEQELGSGSNYQTMTAQRDLAIAELDLVTAMTTYQKSRVELDRATGATLEHNGLLIQEAVTGTLTPSSP